MEKKLKKKIIQTKYECDVNYGDDVLHTYVVSVYKNKKNNNKLTVEIGSGNSNDDPCITFEEDVEKERWFMELFGSGEKCEKNHKLIKGALTKKFLIFALTFLQKELRNFYDSVDFSDASNIDISDGQSISLRKSNILLYGQSWYERTFNAYIDIDSEREERKELISKTLDKPINLEEDVRNKIIDSLKIDSELLELFNKKDVTWREFFTVLATRPNKYKIMFNWYIDVFDILFPTLHIDEDFTIVISMLRRMQIPPITYKITKVTEEIKGGKRRHSYKRKIRKHKYSIISHKRK